MKLFQFDELTYPYVPEIGWETRFSNRFCDPQLVHQTYMEHMDQWKISEEQGFDGIFTNEHHFTAFNIQPACNITTTAITMLTKNIKVGVIGNVIPLRHPIRTAEEFAMIDCLSGGRFIGGIVRGIPAEYVSYNVDPFTSRERVKECFDIIFKALTEEEFDYDGKFYQLTNVSIWPRPIQNPIPFWMPTGSMETIEFCAERRIVGCQVWFPTQMFKDCFDTYRTVAQERFGWNPAFSSFTGGRFIHVAETNEQAIEEAKPALEYMFGPQGFSRPLLPPTSLPGHQTDRSFTHRKQGGDAGLDALSNDVPFEERRSKGVIICGDPDYVTRWLQEDAKTAGYGNLLCMFRCGSLSHDAVMRSKALFAKHCLPELKNINVDQPGTDAPVPRLPSQRIPVTA